MLASLCILAILVGGQAISQAQESGPVVDILGRPESSTDSADAHAYVSVVDPTSGRIIDGLGDDNFKVQISREDVVAQTSVYTTGIALIMVIDRGGIAQRYDPRIGQAVDLAESLLDMLNVDGTASTDMVGLIGIRGRDHGGITPTVPFTDYDPNVVSNEFNALRTETVSEATPLYDGLDRAIEWIADNPDSEIQDKLTHRRPIIVVFSDGIDKNFSDEARRIDIIDKCGADDILLYTVRMGGGATDPYNMEIMAERTNGLYITYDTDSHDEVLSLFENIVTQRQSYRVAFPLHRPRGDYDVRIQVLDAPGDGWDEATVSSRLRLPEITLTSPEDGDTFTVPYSQTIGFKTVEIPLSVEITSLDGIPRDLSEVSYFANGVLIGTSTQSPDFEFEWDVSTVVTPTEETQQQDYTLTAEAEDVYLLERIESAPVTISVTWEAMERTIIEEGQTWFFTYWWLLLILAALAMGLLILLILLIRTRGELARKVVTHTTGVLKGVTKRLGATPQRAQGKLVVLHGANMGREFRLAAQVVKVGRDPQFSDFALYDEFASNPHFSIQMEQTQFFITDEGSTNGTRVNGMPIQPHQRMLLQPDTIIEVGQTRLQFKRLGGTTRQLPAQPGAGPPPRPVQPPHPPTQPAPPSGPAQPPHPPTQLAPPPGQAQQPPQPGQRGGPTRKVPP